MALDIMKTVDIIELMENYIHKIRPRPELRDKVDLSYRIDNQSIILYEERASFVKPGEKIIADYAKTTYEKSTDRWKIYWMRSSKKWNEYAPKPFVKTLSEFLEIVDKDEHYCFKG